MTTDTTPSRERPPLISFEFSLSPATIALALSRARPETRRIRIQRHVAPPDPALISEMHVRVVVGNRTAVFTREVDPLGDLVWIELDHDDITVCKSTDGCLEYEVTASLIIGCALEEFSNVLVDRMASYNGTYRATKRTTLVLAFDLGVL